ncbi:matrixin family metalloprotease [uncultured Limosilactobacillus sp.]|uniref:matrixin family metalloprotease n=1 Tax=uncultured Limosilactobacillus sp. TaxID=2837629 RepID=UPI0025FF56F2|nr:matrixin family metalloprotease [uncultured Limosilactobacillus sp.]
MWLYNDNQQFQRQTNNGITYLKASVQELSNELNGKGSQKTTNQKTAHRESTVNSQTDQINGRWTSRSATIYIKMGNQTLQQAMIDAVNAWNNTGSFKFKIVHDRKQADLVATSANNSNDQAAGLAEMNQNTVSGYFTDGHIYLNKAYLLNPEYGYNHERIVNTAEHELGHAIGLSHNNSQSVMQPSGSFFTIQPTDIQAVKRIYSQKPTKPKQTH